MLVDGWEIVVEVTPLFLDGSWKLRRRVFLIRSMEV